MKHKPEHNKASNDDKPTSADAAMSDYLDDMLGLMSENPLQIMGEKEAPNLKGVHSKDKSTSRPKAVSPSRQKKTTKKAETSKTHLAERENKPVLTPVVIPAAFPKFPPPEKLEEAKKVVEVESKTKPELKVEVEEKRSWVQVDEIVAKPIQPKAKTPPPEKEDLPREEAPLISPPKPREAEPAKTESSPEPIVAEPQVAQPESDALEAPDSETVLSEPQAWLDNGRPPWAQDRFECLLFSVAGLKLAVPLISLGAIYQIEKELTPLVGRAEWFMGLYRTQDRNIQVVDTAKWVMPDRYHEQVKEGYHFIIRLGGNNWGMACDSVHEAIQLDPTQVKWRSERSKRPWLSGTVVEHMCALLDADMLGYLLQQNQRVH